MPPGAASLPLIPAAASCLQCCYAAAMISDALRDMQLLVMSAASDYRRTDVDEVIGHHGTIHLEGM